MYTDCNVKNRFLCWYTGMTVFMPSDYIRGFIILWKLLINCYFYQILVKFTSVYADKESGMVCLFIGHAVIIFYLELDV